MPSQQAGGVNGAKVTIIDTQCANLASVRYAFERLGASVTLSNDPRVIEQSERLILPGVGSANAAMAKISELGLADTLTSLTQPVMGICLGMQLMTKRSDEGRQDCLGLIPTEVVEFEPAGLPLPQMGWNTIKDLEHPVFAGIEDGSYVYFVHGYCAPISDYTVASSDYGQRFSAAIAYNNFIGLQFHPEKSAAVGEQILTNFLRWQG
ncbi:imidazole glycerol phosphate synthase subunit HisH [Paraferrimonas sp. SM1919]|uniref:imidazole glycerol phosphate synthase subunit HisH n=1 Tax=Paraferrimonas sp. SM1919 TaxID=2662263 RepID=UPI0013D03D93|nr:imidazole glycerol phosphate synthase subunit HisH [Paraferrimonas sp. SM1919]